MLLPSLIAAGWVGLEQWLFGTETAETKEQEKVWGEGRHNRDELSNPEARIELEYAIDVLLDERIRREESDEDISEGFDDAIATLTFHKNLTKVASAPSRYAETEDPEED
jgi:hypothetical protein